MAASELHLSLSLDYAVRPIAQSLQINGQELSSLVNVRLRLWRASFAFADDRMLGWWVLVWAFSHPQTGFC